MEGNFVWIQLMERNFVGSPQGWEKILCCYHGYVVAEFYDVHQAAKSEFTRNFFQMQKFLLL